MRDAPQFLIAWSSPWREFLSAIGPALRPSPPRFAQEARAGLFPLRGMMVAFLLEAAALATVIAHPPAEVQEVVPQVSQPTHEVIYFSADELPQTQDLAGAPAGEHGLSGGASVHHPSQTIKVVRGEAMRERVSDAPQLDLPKSESQLSNLLAYKAVPGPAPAEALPLRRPASHQIMAAVPPPPEVRDENRLRVASLSVPVVAPPPATLPGRELPMRTAPVAVAVVPPPVAAPAKPTSYPARLILPAEAVVAPPPELNGTIQLRSQSNTFASRVVSPPAEVDAVRNTGRNGLVGTQAVAPPAPQVEALSSRPSAGLAAPRVSPPSLDVGQAPMQRAMQVANRDVTLRTEQNPNLGSHPSGSANTTPSTADAGVVVSTKPGEKAAVPATPEKAALAMSPSGSATIGSGGDGGGRGTGRGPDIGVSRSGTNSGTTATGTGAGTSLYARNNGTPYPGPGGAGNLSSGTTRVPGVSVSGGKNVITLPSFGAPAGPAAVAKSAGPKGASNAITVVASPRAGGALNLYGALRGDRVYTIYIASRLGTAVMQFADPASAGHTYGIELTAPRAIRVDLPAELTPDIHHSPLLVRCKLDQTGALRDMQILRTDDNDFAEKVLASLRTWKFSPAFRGAEAVAVDAILGFGVDTK